MKHFSWLIAAMLLVCSTQMSYAGSRDCDACLEDCSFCDFDICDVTYDVYVDYLYWKVCRGGALDAETICPGYTSGWRVGANFNYDDWGLGVRYTDFCVSSSRGDLSHKIEFQNVDIDLGYTIHFDCAPIELTPFVGAKLVWINEKWDLEISEGTDHYKLDFDGYGLRIGFNQRWNLCNLTFCDNSIPLAFVSSASTGIVDGSFGFSERRSTCSYVPVHELYLGLEMTFCDLFCDTDASFQIGYEAQSWGFTQIEEDNNATFVGMGGLVARFGFGF